ncbi:MAG: PorT family protein [Bacteroidales bacterium]|nr:PorT family protein [Bacteroidales bacterium]
MRPSTRILLLLLISQFLFQANAQTLTIKGGLNLSNFLMKDNTENYKEYLTMRPGFQLGGSIDIPLFRELISLETGIFFNTKGYNMKNSEEGDGYEIIYTEKCPLYYIDVPINVKAVYGGFNLKGFVTLGPYAGYGLSGKCTDTWEYTYQGTTTTDTETLDVEWGKDNDNDFLRRLDYGITFGGGVIFKRITAGISYDLGLANISSYRDYESKIKNRVLRISGGFIFGKK